MPGYMDHDSMEREKQELRDRAQTHDLLQMYQEAISDYEQLIALDPSDPYSHNGLGFGYEKSGQIERAMNCYRDVIRRFPNHSDAYVRLGRCFSVYKQKKDLARIYYEKAAELDPEDYWAWNNIGHMLQKEGNWRKALYYIKKAFELCKRTASKYAIYLIGHNLAFAYYRCKQYEEAWRLFHQLIGQSMSDVCIYREFDCCSSYKTCIHSDFGCVNYKMGKYRDAIKFFERALGFCPRNRYFQKLIRITMKKIEDSGKAQ